MESKTLIRLFLQQFIRPFILELLQEFFKTNSTLLLNGQSKPEGSSLLTTADVSKVIRFNRHKIYQFITSGELKAIEMGGEYRFKREDVDSFINNRATGQK